jgi:hypothetical protein
MRRLVPDHRTLFSCVISVGDDLASYDIDVTHTSSYNDCKHDGHSYHASFSQLTCA